MSRFSGPRDIRDVLLQQDAAKDPKREGLRQGGDALVPRDARPSQDLSFFRLLCRAFDV